MSKNFHYLKYSIFGVLTVTIIGLLVTFGVHEAEAQRPTTTPAATPAATPSPKVSPTAVASNDSCIACHTDEEQLKATAEEEVEVEKLSEGEG